MRKKNKKTQKQKLPECRCQKCGHLIKAYPLTTDIQICKECGNGRGYERIPIGSIAKSLEGKRIVNSDFGGNSLKLLLDDGSKLIIAAHAGVGADGGWYNWTEVILKTESNSFTLIDH